MKLITMTNVSLDGVMQGLGGSAEDRRGRFTRGGWAAPLFDDEAAAALGKIYARADAFLFGRWTYEVFAGSWGAVKEIPPDNPIALALNTRPKYVVSQSLKDPKWAETTVLSGDIAAAVGKLKAEPGGELQVHGGTKLIRWLLDNDLVDEINLFTYPLILGQGTRLFPNSGPDKALELIECRSTSGGVIIQAYRPRGRPEYRTADDGIRRRSDPRLLRRDERFGTPIDELEVVPSWKPHHEPRQTGKFRSSTLRPSFRVRPAPGPLIDALVEVRRGRRGDPPRRHSERGDLGGPGPGQPRRHSHRARGGAAGRRAQGGPGVVDPRVRFPDADRDPLPASSAPRPDTYYGWTKAAMESLGSLYSDRFGLTVFAVRIGAFQETPWSQVDVPIWLSPDDCVRLFRALIDTPVTGFRVVWGVSANATGWLETRRRDRLRAGRRLRERRPPGRAQRRGRARAPRWGVLRGPAGQAALVMWDCSPATEV